MFQFEFEKRLFTFQYEKPHCESLLQLPPRIRKPVEAHP